MPSFGVAQPELCSSAFDVSNLEFPMPLRSAAWPEPPLPVSQLLHASGMLRADAMSFVLDSANSESPPLPRGCSKLGSALLAPDCSSPGSFLLLQGAARLGLALLALGLVELGFFLPVRSFVRAGSSLSASMFQLGNVPFMCHATNLDLFLSPRGVA